MARTGRWRTGVESKRRILDAARSRLMQGYEQASVRAIAADAGVDVAMVYYFFGNKQGLFAAVVADTGHPLQILHEVLEESPGADLGTRLVRGFLKRWDSGENSEFEPCVAIWQSAETNDHAKQVLLEAVHGPIAERLEQTYGITDAALRVEMSIVHLMGLAMARYRLRIEPAASASPEQLVAFVGPTIQRYLTDPASNLSENNLDERESSGTEPR